jgi:hypothetical protein
MEEEGQGAPLETEVETQPPNTYTYILDLPSTTLAAIANYPPGDEELAAKLACGKHTAGQRAARACVARQDESRLCVWLAA